MAPLLPGDALAGSRVGISVSQSPDLARLGLLEQHFRYTLGEITRAVLVSGGGIVFGGRIDPGGYTSFVATEMQRYARRDRPLLICLAWHEHRQLPLSELDEFRQYLGLFGRLVCLDPDGVELAPGDGRGEAPEPVADHDVRRRALTGLRRYMGEHQRGRVFIGGRLTNYQGAVPGLIEEAAMCLQAGQPMYLAGGFGGATWEITRCLGVTSGDWLPPEQPSAPDDAGLLEGCQLLRQFAEAPEWSGLGNGLTDEENEWLATSHRPADIATLVSLGVTSGDWLPPEQPSAPDDAGLLEGCQLLRQFAEAPEWSGLRNGLTDEENEWLATSHRPADIATLVSLGLGRLAHDRGNDG